MPARNIDTVEESFSTVRLDVRGAALYGVPFVRDARGELLIRESGAGLPFVALRSFVLRRVPEGVVRGQHAHRRCQQLLVCLQGRMSCMLDDGLRRREVLLDNPEVGLYIPPMVWSEQTGFTRDAILQVFASDTYDPEDYIRDYDRFISISRRSNAAMP